jgi:hypothetical protein
MGLRLRRGTNANRLLFTPTEGELIYVTDYATAGVSALWVGDGITLGGNPVDTDTNTQLDLDSNTLSDLGDVNISTDSTLPEAGEFLGYSADSGDWTPKPVQIKLASDYNASGITDGQFLQYNQAGADFRNVTLSTATLEDVNLSVPPTAGQVLKYNAVDGAWEPQDDTDTTLVLGSQSIGDLGDVNTTHDSSLPTHGDTLVYDSVAEEFKTQRPFLSINDLSDVNNDNAQTGYYLVWNGTNYEGVPNPLTSGGTVSLNIVGNSQGEHIGDLVSEDGSTLLINSDTGTFFGTVEGDITGNVTGDVKAQNGVVVLDSGTDGTDATFIGAITATGTLAGDLSGSVFADDSRLMVNALDNEVITDTLETSIIAVPAGEDFVKVAKTGTSADLKLSASYSTDQSASTDVWGRILFELQDTNGATVPGIIGGATGGIFIASDPTGSFADFGKFAQFQEGGLKLGGFDPAEKLDVDGNAKVSGFVQFGSLDTTARNALTAAAGMVIWNTTTSQFEGYDGVNWINLVDGVASP